MAYTPEQQRNIQIALARSQHDTPRVRQALLEAMGVESNFRNLNYGDRDSMGVLQQRRQYYPRSGKNVAYDIDQFLSRARRADHQVGGSAGALAQAVQRSAFPGRYDQQAGRVSALLGGKSGSPGYQVASRVGAPQAAAQSATGLSRQAITSYLLESSNALASGRQVDPNAILQLATLRQQMGPGQQATTLNNGGTSIPVIHGAVDGHTQKALHLVQEAIGTPYVWGGSKPGGFDCSGLLQYAWGKAGVKIPRTTYDQWKAGTDIPRGKLAPGDAVFFRGSDSKGGLPGHVGMYIGGGKFIEAPRTGLNVRVSNLAGRTDYQGARRY